MTWPAMMKRQTVLKYLEVSEASLEREIATGRIPTAVMFGGRQHWHKDAIDKALASFTTPSEPDYLAEMRSKIGTAR